MYSLVIPAAGRGKRMGLAYNKLLYSVSDGQTIIQKTVNKFLSYNEFSEIIIVVNLDDYDTFKQLFDHEKIKLVVGDKERYLSVKCGVEACSNEIIFIHDGARCNISDELIQRCFESIKTPHDGGYVCAVKTIDSIREVQDGCVIKVLDRDKLYNMQTPQIFYKSQLTRAYQLNLADSDEVGLMLQLGKVVKIIDGDYRNVKITTLSDLELL